MDDLIERVAIRLWPFMHDTPFQEPIKEKRDLARAAISEIFDWLEKPSEEARVSGVAEFLKGRTPFPMEVWSAMLSELRKEALGDFQPSASSVETGGDDSTSVEGDGE